jgi:hypothetical protein
MGLVQTGQLARAIESARALQAQKQGGASACALLCWAWASGGQVPSELMCAEPPSSQRAT